MTLQQIESLNLGIKMDAKVELMINAALEWLTENTTIDTEDIEHLPFGARLFLIKFCELNGTQSGVASESIEGLSLSYSTSDTNALLWDIADRLLGKYLKGQVRFVAAGQKYK